MSSAICGDPAVRNAGRPVLAQVTDPRKPRGVRQAWSWC
jgi:hypothetical protein